MFEDNDVCDELRAWGTSGCLVIGDDGTGGAWACCSLRSLEVALLLREYLRMSKRGIMGMVGVEKRNGDDEQRCQDQL